MRISRGLAVSMINCDISGLDDDEIELIRDFPDFNVTDWCTDNKGINAVCSITGLWDHCVEIEVKR